MVFLGRNEELESLKLLFNRSEASLVVVRGRRRIGKSTLVEKFAEDQFFLEFAGLAPDGKKPPSAQDQRQNFARQLSQQLKVPMPDTADWSNLFSFLSLHVRKRRVIILLDEISWMASDDLLFLSKLKNAWDLEFRMNPKLVLILCGSVSTWIEDNIINSKAFYGRISLFIRLDELPLEHCHALLDALGFRRSVFEELLLLSVMGGVPWYLNHVQPKLSAEENLRLLCFQENGILFKEFDRIFSDIFGSRSEIYLRIGKALVQGNLEFDEICQALQYSQSGTVSAYLGDLMRAGFVARDYTLLLKSGKSSRLSHYRLSDNYLRFYLKYIAPYKEAIERGRFSSQSLMTLPGWNTIMRLQFENLVLKNRSRLWAKMGLKAEEIMADNPYFQRKTTRQAGVQVDYLIHTRYNTVFVCEIKFSKDPLGTSIIAEMKEKLSRISLPRRYSCVPVIIHSSGVQDSVRDSGFFTHIIDFADLMR